MSKPRSHAPNPRPANRRRKPAHAGPKRNPPPAHGPRVGSLGRSSAIGEVMQLVHEGEAEERAAGDPLQAYQARQRLEQRLSALAERIGQTGNPSRDDLLALALAGWYAGGARQALVRALLQAGGMDPREPRLAMRRRSQPRGRMLP
jgi:hypothetical protein